MIKYLQVSSSLLLFSLLSLTNKGFAQTESTMYFMNSLPQVTYYNPALKPAYKMSIGLPGSSVFFQYGNNGFTYNDFISKQNNVLTADLDKLYGSLKEKNYLNANTQVDLFRVSLKAGARLYFTFNVSAKSYNRMMVPKDLTGIFIDGTEPYLNSTATLSPKLESTTYAEIGWGAAYTVNKKLTVGAKLKLLKGAVNATTQRATLNLSLSDTYAITATGDLDARTSGIHNFDDSNYEVSDNWRDYTKNNGVAFDLGATYKVMDRLTIGASLIDIGGITWKNDLYGYQLDPAKARYTFEGIDLHEILNGDGSDYFNSLSDSLEEKFKVTEGRIGKYRTPLPAKIYLSGAYELRRYFTVGALLFAEKYRGRFVPGFTASLNKEFGKWLGASLSYTMTNNSFNNIGAGLSLNLAPLQIYVVGDNLLRAPLTLMKDSNLNAFVNNMHYFNLRAGVNFVFGRDKVQERQPYPKQPR